MLDALDYLIGLIDDGGEFPSAVSATCAEFGFCSAQQAELTTMYDEVTA